jgi:hypothetical protein
VIYLAVDTTTLVNFIFSVIVLILGFWVYRAKKIVLALYIALAFALFAISHLAILLGTPSANISILIIRSLGYLVIIYALAREAIR